MVVDLYGETNRVADMDVAAPYPRDQNYRTSETYNSHCRTISRCLQEAIEQ